MTLEQLTETLMRCNALAEARERSRAKEEILEAQIQDEQKNRLDFSREITRRLDEIEPILRRMPESGVLLIGEWVYWEGDDGPCQAKVRRAYDLAGLLAEIASESASDDPLAEKDLDPRRCEMDDCENLHLEGSPFCESCREEFMRQIDALKEDDEPVADAIERVDARFPDRDEEGLTKREQENLAVAREMAAAWCGEAVRTEWGSIRIGGES